jgi:hypothetical protein
VTRCSAEAFAGAIPACALRFDGCCWHESLQGAGATIPGADP